MYIYMFRSGSITVADRRSMSFLSSARPVGDFPLSYLKHKSLKEAQVKTISLKAEPRYADCLLS